MQEELGRGAEARRLVARAAGVHAAVRRAPDLVRAVDVLHHVQLADRRPVPAVPPVRRTQGPERGPVAQGGVAGGARHLHPALDGHLAARRRLEVRPLGLDATGGPVARAVAQRGDPQVARAVQGDVVGAGGAVLDLPGAPVPGAAGVAVTGVEDPVLRGGQRVGAAGEVVAPLEGPARGGGRDRGVGVQGESGGKRDEHRGCRRDETSPAAWLRTRVTSSSPAGEYCGSALTGAMRALPRLHGNRPPAPARAAVQGNPKTTGARLIRRTAYGGSGVPGAPGQGVQRTFGLMRPLQSKTAMLSQPLPLPLMSAGSQPLPGTAYQVGSQ